VSDYGKRWCTATVDCVLKPERHLRLAVTEYAEHYHVERPHQWLANRLIAPDPGETISAGDVKRRERLGGTLSFCYREAA